MSACSTTSVLCGSEPCQRRKEHRKNFGFSYLEIFSHAILLFPLCAQSIQNDYFIPETVLHFNTLNKRLSTHLCI